MLEEKLKSEFFPPAEHIITLNLYCMSFRARLNLHEEKIGKFIEPVYSFNNDPAKYKIKVIKRLLNKNEV